MKVIGITGYIGTGKSTVSKIFLLNGFKYFDSDSYVSGLNSKKKIVRKIKKYFPQSIVNNKINKKKLKKEVFKDYEKNIVTLEQIYHPFVVRKIKTIVFFNRYIFKKNLVLEVPLLFQINVDKLCDMIIWVKSSEDNQLKRVSKRSNLDLDDLYKVMNKQKTLNYENKFFHYVINTDFSLETVNKQVNSIINNIR